ncbi:MAG: sigma-70 family RNA polymerase sigma factor [Solirubrobacteraceae bacterium]
MGAADPDAQRFEALYRAHYGAIVRFAHRRIDRDSVEEVVAETFATAWRRLDAVPRDALPWLYVVARNVIAAKRRSVGSGVDKQANIAAVGWLSARDPADALGERDLIRRAFNSLSEHDREALRLVGWEGLDQRQAARVCGTSRVAFAMRLSRARRRLAAALSADQPSRVAHPIPTPTEESNL